MLSALLRRKTLLATLLIAFAGLMYVPLLTQYFWSDDWYILSLAQISSFSEFLSYFSFRMTDLATPVYRPLSTQVFYCVFYNVFGLNPLPYHLFSFAVWAVGAGLLYHLLKTLFANDHSAILGLFVYVFSASHFTRLTYLATFQEILMFFFAIMALIYIQRCSRLSYVIAIGAFVGALLSKETAVVIPVLMFLVEWYRHGKLRFGVMKKYVPVFMILGIYLFLRFYVRGLSVVGVSYAWDFSLFTALHTATWYGLWSLGLPEFVIDYVGSGVKIIPRFWIDFGVSARILAGGFIALGVTLILLLLRWLLKNVGQQGKKRTIVLGLLWFFVALTPILFLPGHKFALGQSLAVVGLSFFMIAVLKSASKIVTVLFIVVFLSFNIFSVSLYYSHYVSIQRSTISRNVVEYLMETHPEPPAGFFFINDKDVVVEGWGLSRQIHQAMSDHYLTVLYGKGNEPEVKYEDETPFVGFIPSGWVVLPSSPFIK